MRWHHRLAARLRLRPPQLPTQRERHATWLELFFDLVFVLALANVQNRLDDQPGGDVATTLVLYAAVWWAWASQTFYDTRFDPDDVPHRLAVMAAMAGAAAMALGARDAPDTRLLPIGYLVARASLLALYFRVRGSTRTARRVTEVYLLGSGVAWLLWLGSLAAPAHLRSSIWITAMLVDTVTPLAGRSRLTRLPVHPSHLPERVGQFTIILLGSTLTDLMDGVPERPGVEVLAVAAAAFVVPAVVWWAYTRFVTKGLAFRRLSAGLSYAYLHAVIGAALLLLGWALGQVIRHVAAGVPELSGLVRILLAASLGTWMLCGLILQWVSLHRLPAQRIGIALFGISSVAIITAVVRDPVTTIGLLAVLLVGYANLLTRQLTRVSSEQHGP